MEVGVKTKSALSYFGSDSEVAPRLGALLDDCTHVTIPFCGGLSILPHLKARAIVANDKNELAIDFYRAMTSELRDELIARCKRTLSHPAEIDAAYCSMGMGQTARAWGYWVMCWVGRKGKGGTKGEVKTPSVRRTADGGTNASRVRAAANDLDEWAKHFERCEFESVCFRELLPKVANKPGCGLYIDAPWWDAGRVYLHPFEEKDHVDLANLLQRFDQTKVVIRYGDHPRIRELYDGWQFIEAESRTQANSNTREVWIVNR